MKYTEEGDIKWAAGLFEGEGYLYYNKQNQSWTIGIEMTDKDVIEKLSDMWDISFTTSKRLNRPDHHLQPYHARVSARSKIFAIVCNIYPYLGARRRQKCDEFLEWYAAKEGKRYD